MLTDEDMKNLAEQINKFYRLLLQTNLPHDLIEPIMTNFAATLIEELHYAAVAK
jgi:hypothetical protein